MKKVFFVILGVFVFHTSQALAGPCVVTIEEDDINDNSSLRQIVERVIYNNDEGGCIINSDYADSAAADMYIAFQTPETKPTGTEVREIVLLNSYGPLDLKPLFSVIIGNMSDEAINGDNDASYNPDHPNYAREDNGEIKDYGFVVIDGTALGEGVNPFNCKDGASSVYLRNLLVVTDGVTDIFDGSEACLKNGGDVFVCNGTLKTDANGDFIDPNSYDGSDTGTDGGTTNGRGITRANLSITDGISYGPDATDTDTSTQNGIPDDYWCQKPCEDETFYYDADGDGYGDSSNTLTVCPEDLPDGYVSDSSDCDDADADINPGEEEVCEDGIDQDCDGRDDDCVEPPEDADGDGYTVEEGDCDDNDASVNPGAEEVCGDGIDQDCDGADFSGTIWYVDVDVDGYGSDDTTIVSCDLPEGYVSVGGDCDDSDTTISPVGTEICENGIDENCDSYDNTCTSEDDYDGDGYTESQGDCNDNNATVYPGAKDICDNGIDEDCDGAGKSCSPEVCDDDTDNDGDEDTDCEDDDCDTFNICNGQGDEEVDCTNGIDDDGDGGADCGDYYCRWNDDACANVEPEADCSDALDNDNDALIDCEDDDCADVEVDDDGNTCADLGLSPVGDAAYMAGGGGCSCDLTANRTASANELLPMLLGTLLLGSIVALRRRVRRKEV